MKKCPNCGALPKEEHKIGCPYVVVDGPINQQEPE